MPGWKVNLTLIMVGSNEGIKVRWKNLEQGQASGVVKWTEYSSVTSCVSLDPFLTESQSLFLYYKGGLVAMNS